MAALLQPQVWPIRVPDALQAPGLERGLAPEVPQVENDKEVGRSTGDSGAQLADRTRQELHVVATDPMGHVIEQHPLWR